MDSIIFISIIVSSLWVLFDAKTIGVKKGQVKGLANMGPLGWFVACLLIWIIAFPLYLAKRGMLKEINVKGKQARWNNKEEYERWKAGKSNEEVNSNKQSGEKVSIISSKSKLSPVHWAGIAVGSLLLLLYIFSGSPTPEQKTIAPAPQMRSASIEYKVKGEKFSLTYTNSQGNTEQIGEYTGDWNYKFNSNEKFFHAYVSAQNKRAYGPITAEVWINGKKEESSTSQGAYVIAAASRMLQ